MSSTSETIKPAPIPPPIAMAANLSVHVIVFNLFALWPAYSKSCQGTASPALCRPRAADLCSIARMLCPACTGSYLL